MWWLPSWGSQSRERSMPNRRTEDLTRPDRLQGSRRHLWLDRPLRLLSSSHLPLSLPHPRVVDTLHRRSTLRLTYGCLAVIIITAGDVGRLGHRRTIASLRLLTRYPRLVQRRIIGKAALFLSPRREDRPPRRSLNLVLGR